MRGNGELPAWGMESAPAGLDFASSSGDRPLDLETVEREHILRVLKTTGGNRKKAIDILGISERALRYKLKDYKEKGFYSGKD
jgi:two-component system response regulator FlrC